MRDLRAASGMPWRSSVQRPTFLAARKDPSLASHDAPHASAVRLGFEDIEAIRGEVRFRPAPSAHLAPEAT